MINLCRLAFVVVVSLVQYGNTDQVDERFAAMVETDWVLQEAKLGRTLDSREAIADLIGRSVRLLDYLSGQVDCSAYREQLEQYRREFESYHILDARQRETLYKQIRWLARSAAFKNPVFPSNGLVFMKRRRFICQMLHEYLGYFYDYGDIAGGGIYRLARPGRSMEIQDLIQDRLAQGNYTTLSLSYDGRTIYFAYAKRSVQKPDFYSIDRNCFHLYSMQADGTGLVQLTDGVDDDFDPCELPDGSLVFMSTRRGGFGRCHNPWEPLPTYTLHRMNPDGGGIRTLSYHETNEWHPSVLPDGRIVYTRWDYVDRSAAHYHGLWVCNPDGSNPRILFGNYTQTINACYQPRAVPNSDKIVFVAGAHHADVGGALVMLSPDRVSYDPETGEDHFQSVEVLTPEVCFPEAPGWPDTFYHSPWPLSEEVYLVSYSLEPLPGMGPKVEQDSRTGLYYFDRFGNRELLYRDPDISSMYPIPLRAREKPPVVPSIVYPDLRDEGEFMLTNVNDSLYPLPADRPIHSLRVFQILPKSETHVANQPRLGYANAESARLLLGTVPVEADGSAYFRAPAKKPLAFQAVDADGKAVQGMRSITYLQPGERRGCVGCHEPYQQSGNNRFPIAFAKQPAVIQPGPDGSNPWNFQRLVQPILDRHCIQCHHDNSEAAPPALVNKPAETFTVAYDNLRPYARWYEWGDQSIRQIVTKPGEMPSTISPLVSILQDANHRDTLQLSNEEIQAIYLWLDGNASFYGTYISNEQIAQKQGKPVAVPVLQ